MFKLKYSIFSTCVKLFCSWFSSLFFLVWHQFPLIWELLSCCLPNLCSGISSWKKKNIPLFSFLLTMIKSSLYKDRFHTNWASKLTLSRSGNGQSEKLFDSPKTIELSSKRVKAWTCSSILCWLSTYFIRVNVLLMGIQRCRRLSPWPQRSLGLQALNLKSGNLKMLGHC